MSSEDNFSISELRRKRELQAMPPPPSSGNYGGPPPTNVGPAPQGRPAPAPVHAAGSAADDEDESEFHVDIWRMLAALRRQWLWLVVGTALLGGLGLAGGYYRGRYKVTVTLTRPETGGPSPGTLTSLLQDWQLARRVAAKSNPKVDAAALEAVLSVWDEPKTERLHLALEGKNSQQLVDLVNLYATEAVAYAREEQVREPQTQIPFWQEKIRQCEERIRVAQAAFANFQKAHGITDPDAAAAELSKKLADVKSRILEKQMEIELADFNQINQLTERWAAIKLRRETELASLTENHPTVQTLRAEMARLELEIATARSNATGTATARPGINPSLEKLKVEIANLKKEQAMLEITSDKLPEIKAEYVRLKSELDSLHANMERFVKSAEDVATQAQQARGYFWISAPATLLDVDTRLRKKKAFAFGSRGALVGLIFSAALVLLVEFKQRTIKTVGEVEHTTGLRVLATLGDLDKMSASDRNKWAFRAWTIIAGQLNASANHGMVCGFVSSGHGEGRSTWIKLLAEAATRRGLRVLTVATKPSGSDEPSSEKENAANERSFTEAVEEAMTERQTAEAQQRTGDELARVDPDSVEEVLTLSPSALAFPAEVTQRFTSGNLPAAHIPLPGWVWNLDRRRQWQMALAHWRAIDNLVLLVELPPASVPESVLLAESLPQIIWLVDSGKASIRETKEQLETMRHARCQIVGAVLNHEPEPIIKL